MKYFHKFYIILSFSTDILIFGWKLEKVCIVYNFEEKTKMQNKFQNGFQSEIWAILTPNCFASNSIASANVEGAAIVDPHGTAVIA